MILRCASHVYGLNVNAVKAVFIKTSFAPVPTVQFIIGELKLKRISLNKSPSSNDSTWSGSFLPPSYAEDWTFL